MESFPCACGHPHPGMGRLKAGRAGHQSATLTPPHGYLPSGEERPCDCYETVPMRVCTGSCAPHVRFLTAGERMPLGERRAMERLGAP